MARNEDRIQKLTNDSIILDVDTCIDKMLKLENLHNKFVDDALAIERKMTDVKLEILGLKRILEENGVNVEAKIKERKKLV